MRTLIRIPLLFVAALCFAQTPDPNRQLLEEVKALRATVDRMAQVIVAMQHTQEQTLAALQLARCESRLGMLETDRRDLTAQERTLASRTAALESALQGDAGSVNAAGLKVPGGTPDPRLAVEAQGRLDGARRSRDEIRTKLQANDRQSAELRSRIEQLRRQLDGAQ